LRSRTSARRVPRIVTTAVEAGLGDLSTFNRRFRHRFGQTPTEFRRPGTERGFDT